MSLARSRALIASLMISRQRVLHCRAFDDRSLLHPRQEQVF